MVLREKRTRTGRGDTHGGRPRCTMTQIIFIITQLNPVRLMN